MSSVYRTFSQIFGFGRIATPSFFLVVVIGLSSAIADAQNCPTCDAPQEKAVESASGQEWIFTKNVDEVSVLFTASHKGKFVDDLTSNDVVVQDDKKPPSAVIDFHTQRDLPLRVGLVVDTSDSVQPRFKFEQNAAGSFLGEIVKAGRDLGFIMGFSEKPNVVQDFSDDTQLLSHGLAKLHRGGGTALFDAVAAAAEKLKNRPEQQMVARIIVVLSDGEDNSSHLKLEDAIRLAQQSELMVYAISTNPVDLRLEGDQNLQKLADETGGRALFPTKTKEVAKAFSHIEDELRSRYAVSYRPADFKADGHFRHIKIVARRLGKKLKVRARRGYYALGQLGAGATALNSSFVDISNK